MRRTRPRSRLRLACGNGLAASVWDTFQQRFRIPQILEFYAATEGGISLFNVQGKPGAIGHIPAYLAHRFSPALVAFDFDKGEPPATRTVSAFDAASTSPARRSASCRTIRLSAGSRFEGYTSTAETEKRMLRHVFAAGDAWVRTGDLMRRTRRATSISSTASGTPFAGRARTWRPPRWRRALRFRRHTACQRLRSRDSRDRRPRRDGGHRMRRRTQSRRAIPASRRAAARLRVSAFSSALSAGRVNRHLQVCEVRSRPSGLQPWPMRRPTVLQSSRAAHLRRTRRAAVRQHPRRSHPFELQR